MASWVDAAIMAGTALVGIAGTKKASDAAKSAAKDNNAMARYIFDTQRADLAPYRAVGGSALNAYARAMGLPQYNAASDYSQGHPLYGDGDTPLTREGLAQAYRDVLGRDPDEGGLEYYLTGGPKEGKKGSNALASGIGAAAGGYFGGPIGSAIGGALGGSLFGKDKRERRSFTFNEFLNATLGSDEYKQRVASGDLQAWDESRRSAIFSPQQEFIGGSETNPDDRYGGFYESPGYQFRLDEGARGLDRNMAARGLLNSGARGKAMTRYNQGVASEEFGNYMNRLAGAAGIGQTAVNSGNALAGQYGQNVMQNNNDAASARASGYLGGANTIMNALNNYQLYKALG